jgi:hypothetical protein
MRRAVLLCALAGLGVTGAKAAQPAVDAELLEFLGSIDSDDDSWQEYLEHKPVKRADKQTARQPPKQEAKAPPPKPEVKKVKDK